MIDTMNIVDLTTAFDGFLQSKNLAAGTRVKYAHALDTFADWVGIADPGDLTTAQLDIYLAVWGANFESRLGRAPAPATRKAQVVALRVFYEYLDRIDALKGKNPALLLEAPHVPQKPIDWLRADEEQALLGAAYTDAEKIIVSLLRWTGLRISEASNLRFSDIHLIPGGRRINVRTSKTAAGFRTVPIPPQLFPGIIQWIEYLRLDDRWKLNAPVLQTSSGGPMAATYIDRVLKRVAYNAGVRPIECSCGSSTKSHHLSGCARGINGDNRSTISAHTLRRTYGSDLLNRGVRIDAVSKLLGHSSTKMTEQAYAQLLPSTIAAELERVMGWAA